VPYVPDDLKAALESYVTAPGRLRESLANLDAGALNRRPPGSDWSIRDIVIHLVDTEIVRASRIFAVIAQDDPVILSFDEEMYKRRLHYLWRDPELSLSLFQHLRFAIGEMLEQCDRATWERAGIHEHNGPITLADLLRRGAHHGEEHIAQVIEHRRLVGDPMPA
jgi:hypothetical protein